MLNDKLGEVSIISNEFRDILRENDSLYNFKVGFSISYTSQNKYYNLEIYPNVSGFDSRQYFIDNFETEKGQKKLSEFADKNNIGLITY